MASKEVEIEGLGTVTLYKRHGTHSIRLSILGGDKIRVTMPTWTPYRVGMEFAKSKREWILSQKVEPAALTEGRRIGQSHTLHFVKSTGTRVTTRIKDDAIYVGVPTSGKPTEPTVQEAARNASIRALKLQAEQLLPGRVQALASQHGFTYRSITIKQLKGRWGSCDQQKNLVFNCFLMELPWKLIDYVIMHELVHTRIMAHGKPFWDEVARYVPNLVYIRKVMRTRQPTL